MPCDFATAHVPPLPPGSFDVVLLLETMLAFEDKDALVRAIAAALRPGGRLAFTLEAGPPLTTAEQAAMPDADTVWLTTLDAMVASLEQAGLAVTWQEDHSREHLAMARALTTRLPQTPATSPRRSAAGRWTTCSPRIGSGSNGWKRRGSGRRTRGGGGARLALGGAERDTFLGGF